MFGKKKRLAKQLAQQQAEQAQNEQQEKELQQPTIDELVEESKIFVESELLDDDDVDSTQEFEAIAYILKQEQGEALQAKSLDEIEAEEKQAEEQQAVEQENAQPTQEVAKDTEEQEPVQDEQPQAEESENADEETPADDDAEQQQVPTVQEEQKEEVVYVVDGEEDDDEVVKAAKLVKLPNLVDYMLAQNMTKRMKLNIATLLLSAYQKFKHIPEEKKIIIKCMAKVMQSLMQDVQQ